MYKFYMKRRRAAAVLLKLKFIVWLQISGRCAVDLFINLNLYYNKSNILTTKRKKLQRNDQHKNKGGLSFNDRRIFENSFY